MFKLKAVLFAAAVGIAGGAFSATPMATESGSRPTYTCDLDKCRCGIHDPKTGEKSCVCAADACTKNPPITTPPPGDK